MKHKAVVKILEIPTKMVFILLMDEYWNIADKESFVVGRSQLEAKMILENQVKLKCK